jgi:hypothetical protein
MGDKLNDFGISPFWTTYSSTVFFRLYLQLVSIPGFMSYLVNSYLGNWSLLIAFFLVTGLTGVTGLIWATGLGLDIFFLYNWFYI